MTHDQLTSLLSYDPATGKFRWKSARQRICVGELAGYIKKPKGYVYIQVCGKTYAAHRLAWFYMTGTMPTHCIDHINRDTSDNRIQNLREATHGQNRANSQNNNQHGLKGVRRLPWMKDTDRCWQAQITHEKKVIYLGCFYTKEEAHSAYCDAAKRLHGLFASP